MKSEQVGFPALGPETPAERRGRNALAIALVHAVLLAVLLAAPAWAALAGSGQVSVVYAGIGATLLAGAALALGLLWWQRASAWAIRGEERYRTIFNGTREALLVHDLDGRFTDINDTAARLFGITREEVGGLDVARDLSGPGNRIEELPGIWRRVLEGETVSLQWNARRPDDGRQFPAEVSLQRVSLDGRPFVLASVRDVTETRRAERELRASEERFRTMSSIGTEGILVHADGIILDANLAFAKLVGVEAPDALIGKRGLDVVPLTSSSWREVREHAAAGSADAYDIEVRRPDGSTFPAETSGRDILYRGTKARLVSMRDVTRRKVAEAERARLELGLRQAQRLESIGLLAGGVAHDFNNALSVILSFAENLVEEVTEEQRSSLEAIRTAARSAAALTRHLLAFARNEPAVTRPVEIRAILRTLADMLLRTLPRSIAIEVLAPGSEPDLVVLGDRAEIEHALLNLALNARDAMPRGGKLTLSCRARTLEAWEMAERPGMSPGPAVQIDVEDTGTGIPPEVLPRIFEPLFTTKSEGKGTGLGLSSVYGVVRALRGAIQVYTEPWRGTRFSLLFPAAMDPARAAPAPRVRPGIAVVADDNPAQREVARRIALALFESVLEAADGPEALAHVERREGKVAAVIADYDMPGMTGGDLAAVVRERWPAVAVVVLSGLHREVGAFPLLRKPFAVSDLEALLPPPAAS